MSAYEAKLAQARADLAHAIQLAARAEARMLRLRRRGSR